MSSASVSAAGASRTQRRPAEGRQRSRAGRAGRCAAGAMRSGRGVVPSAAGARPVTRVSWQDAAPAGCAAGRCGSGARRSGLGAGDAGLVGSACRAQCPVVADRRPAVAAVNPGYRGWRLAAGSIPPAARGAALRHRSSAAGRLWLRARSLVQESRAVPSAARTLAARSRSPLSARRPAPWRQPTLAAARAAADAPAVASCLAGRRGDARRWQPIRVRPDTPRSPPPNPRQPQRARRARPPA